MKIVAIASILLGYTVFYAGLSRGLGSKYKGNTIIALLGFNSQSTQGTILGQTEFFQTGTGQPPTSGTTLTSNTNGAPITTTSGDVNP